MLSDNAKKALNIALGSRENGVGDEVTAAIDANGSGPAANVADIKPTSNMTALSPTAASFSSANSVLSTTDTYSDAAVKTAINGAVNAATAAVKTYLDAKADNNDADGLRTEAEARLDAIETKIDAILAALQAVGMMS